MKDHTEDLVLLWGWDRNGRYIYRAVSVEDAVRWAMQEMPRVFDPEIEVIRADGSSERFHPSTHPLWQEEEARFAPEGLGRPRPMYFVLIDGALYKHSEDPAAAEREAAKARTRLGDRVTVVRRPST